MISRYRFGILGTGMIAHKFAEATAVLQDVMELRAIASRSEDKAKAFAAQYGIPDAYGSYEALAQAGDIDVVYVATPHNFHLEQIILLAQNHKHVLCEKPIGISSREALQLRDLSEQYHVFIMEAYWSLFVPAFDKLLALYRENVIGTSRFLRSEIGFSHTGTRAARKIDPELAGGALLDIGVYNIMIAGELFGYDSQLVDIQTQFGENGVDLYDAFVLKHPDDRVSYNMCTVKGKMDNKMILYGDKGCLTLVNFLGSQKVILDLNGESPIDFEFPFLANGYEYEIRHVCQCLDQNKLQSNIMPLVHSENILRIADDIRQRIGLKYRFEEAN